MFSRVSFTKFYYEKNRVSLRCNPHRRPETTGGVLRHQSTLSCHPETTRTGSRECKPPNNRHPTGSHRCQPCRTVDRIVPKCTGEEDFDRPDLNKRTVSVSMSSLVVFVRFKGTPCELRWYKKTDFVYFSRTQVAEFINGKNHLSRGFEMRIF